MTVLSVQKHTITIASGNASAQADLTGGPVLANCVPFFSTRVSSVSTNGANDVDEYAVSVDFVAGAPDKVRARTANFGTLPRALVVEVAVVEFDPAKVNVYQGTATISEGATSTALSDAFGVAVTVDLSKSWLTFGYIGVGDWENMFNLTARGRFTSTSELTFDVTDTGSTVGIDWYVAEAVDQGGGVYSWEVDPVSITIADITSSNTATLSPAVSNTAKTFLLGSYNVSAGISGTAVDSTSVDAVLTNGSTVTCSRYGEDGPINWSGFAVELAGNENVYRGNISQVTPTASENDNIGATVASADSMVVRAGNIGSLCAGAWSGFNQADMPDAMPAFTFVGTGDVTQITCQHAINGTENGTVSISWEVIEWDVGGAPPVTPRRVMVIT